MNTRALSITDPIRQGKDCLKLACRDTESFHGGLLRSDLRHLILRRTMYLLVINYNISSGWPTTRSIAQDSKAGGMCAFQQSSVQTGVKMTSSMDIHVPLGARLILRNLPRSRPLCVQDFRPSWLVRMLANIQQLAKIPLTHLATSAELGGKRGTIKGSKAPRLFRQRGFELP